MSDVHDIDIDDKSFKFSPIPTSDYDVDYKPIIPWHPKLSPYRALTLFIGIGLGTLKAILVYNEVEVASITIEWALGTVLYLTFYILGLWEDGIRNEGLYSCFFNYDCMDPIWRMLAVFGVRTPTYSTHEEPEKTIPGASQILVTNYRLLISTTAIAFGMFKATLSYRGLSDGATALDWIFGVVVTSVIYIIGLYEHNPSKTFNVLFGRNDSPIAALLMREGFLILFSTFMAYIPIFSVTTCLNLIGPFHDTLVETIKVNSAAGWGYYLASLANYAITMDAGIFFTYLTLFTPTLSIYIMLRYFEPTAVVPKSFRFIVQRYNLGWLAPLAESRAFFRTIFLNLFSLIMTVNSIFLHTVGLVVAVSYVVASVGIAIITYQYSILVSIFFVTMSFVLALFFVGGAVMMSRRFALFLGFK